MLNVCTCDESEYINIYIYNVYVCMSIHRYKPGCNMVIACHDPILMLGVALSVGISTVDVDSRS